MVERGESTHGKKESAAGKPDREGPYARLGAVATILGVVIAYLGFAFTVHWWPYNPANARPTSDRTQSTPTPLSASINLRSRLLVPECASISGSVKTSIFSSKQLWLFTEIPNGAQHPSNIFYLLHQLQPNSQGTWSADIQLGERGEESRPFWLEVVSSDPSLTGPLNVKDLSEGSSTGLPANFDSPPLARMEVVRGASNSSTADSCHSYATINAR